MSEINYQALREAAEAIKVVATPQKLLAFRMKVTPQVVLALLDEIKRLEDTNIDAMCRIAELETNLAALVAENVGLKAICDDRRRFIMNGVQMGYIKVPAAETDPDLETIRIAISPQKPIPATDAFLSEVRAQGVEMMREHPSIKLCSLTHICDELAAQIRKGVQL
ncbi:ead/Ea22-like family protein [Escherichia coli]|nr:ead/Ea22-like family protein [Escherichia coli]